MTRTEHAMKLYDLALSVLRARGRPRLIGSTVIREYSYGLLTIRYQPAARHMVCRQGVGGRAVVQ